jgi:hypothetical protein
MKKIAILILLFVGLTACENQPWSFPDYDLQAVYFPVQSPVRTLSMGEDRIDNSLDKEGKFDIGVTIGGMYENKQNWTVDYVVDPTLTDNVFVYAKPQTFSASEQILPLPTSYYTLSPTGTVTIPVGSMNGLIRVELTDAFFNDPISITGRYVIPLKLTGTSADSVLQGKAAVTGADPRIISDWNANQSPKNWVMFAINYVNPYHGTWLHRCKDVTKSTKTGNDTVIYYRNRYVEKDLLAKLTTTARNQVITNTLGNLGAGGKNSMVLTFDNDKGTPGNVTISQSPTSTYVVTGTGHFQDVATSNESWSGMKFQSIYLSYSYNDGTYNHQINDTLVFRDRGIKFTTNNIVVKK